MATLTPLLGRFNALAKQSGMVSAYPEASAAGVLLLQSAGQHSREEA